MTFSYLQPKRISELSLVSDVVDSDLFILNNGVTETKAIPFSILKNKIINLVNSDAATITVSNAPPLVQKTGDVWITPNNRELNYWNGSLWEPVLKDYIKHNLEDAKNVEITSYVTRGVLLWNTLTSKWKFSESEPMLMGTYDTNNSGVVDNSDRLGGNLPTYYLNRLNHTGKLPLSELAQETATVNQILRWNNTNWVPADNRLRDLVDVNIPSLPATAGFVLSWNHTTSRFVLTQTTDKGHDILYNGTALTVRTLLDFTGDLVNVTDNSGAAKTVVNISLPNTVVRWSQVDSNGNNIIDLAETANVANSVHWNNVTNKPVFVQTLNDLTDVDITPAPVSGDSGKALIWDGTKYVLGIPVDQQSGHQILFNNNLVSQRLKLNFKGGGVTVTDNATTQSTEVEIPLGEVSTASNLGTGLGVYSTKVATDFRFRSIKAGAGITLNLINSNNEIEITRNALVAADIPNLDTSKITTGTFALARIPTIPNTQTSGFGTSATRNVPADGDASTTEVVLGNDSRLFNSRTPTGAASGDLENNYPGPTIKPKAVTYNKIQDVSASKFLVRFANTTGIIQEGTFSTGLSLDSATGNLTVNAAQVNHNSLLNYSVNQHIDHSSISISAGVGLTGGGDLTATRTISLGTPSSITTTSTNSTSGTTHTHAITGFAASTITITAGTGLTGGGDLSTNRTIAIANTGVTAGTYTKLTVNAQGQATAGTSLVATDIPDLDFSKIATGTVPVTQGGTGSTTRNFVDLTSTENISGSKTFIGGLSGRESQGVIAVNSSGTTALDIRNTAGTGNAAYMTFHRQGSYAVRFGLDTDNNLKVGGWSMGNVSYRIWHEGNLDPVDTNSNQTIAGAKTFSNNPAFNGGSLILQNGTSNWVSWLNVGTAPPSFTTRSVGTKLLLFSTLGAANVDYAIGIEGSHQWYSIPSSSTTNGFKWYAGTTQVARLDGVGNLGLNSNLTLDNLVAFTSGNTGTPTLNTRTPGTRMLLRGLVSGTGADISIGIEGAEHLWFGCHAATSGYGFKWFAGTTQVAKLNGIGDLEIAGNFVADGVKLNNSVLSSDPAVLDYYLENTWTPTLFGTTTAGSFTYTTRLGWYTRNGREVTVTCSVVISTVTTAPTGNIAISGLPFAINNTAGLVFLGSMRATLGTADVSQATAYAAGATSTGTIYLTSNTGFIPFSGLAANNFVQFTLTYFV